MVRTMNLCTAVLPARSFDETLAIASAAGFHGIELRVDDRCHVSLDGLERDGARIRRRVERARLQLSVLSSYIPLDHERTVARLLAAASALGVRQARVVLPRCASASVARQARTRAIIPAYDAREEPRALLGRVQATLARLERAAAVAGVQLLLELHWGTVMSSFSSAYFLLHNLHPTCIAATFDPANMLVEGKEDWEYGIQLIRPHLANVHVKNVRWDATPAGWEWAWAPLAEGMVDWPDLLALLRRNGYSSAYAIEDFLTPQGTIEATAHLAAARAQFGQLRHRRPRPSQSGATVDRAYLGSLTPQGKAI